MKPEARVEGYLISQVKRRGGLCIKWIPIVRGLPDRIILLPGGRFFMVETKAPRGRLRPDQRVIHTRFAKRGHRVWVLNSRKAIDSWLADVVDLPPELTG